MATTQGKQCHSTPVAIGITAIFGGGRNQTFISEVITAENQLKDINLKSKKERPWKEKKIKTDLLGASYSRISELHLRKAERVKECATFLEFREYQDNNELRLNKGYFCKVRLCPMCAWRRSKKVFSQVSNVMNEAVKLLDVRFIFGTFTVENVCADELDETIDNMFKAYNRLNGYQKIKNSVLGWFRAFEITHDTEPLITKAMYYNPKRRKYYDSRGLKHGDPNPNFDKYHPHFHVIMMVKGSYFKKKDQYIDHAGFVDLWKRALKVDYNPVVHIKAFTTMSKENTAKGVSEVAKYTVKDADWLSMDEEDQVREDITDASVKTLDKALQNRRLIAYGGKLKEIHKELNLDDPLDGDLVHAGDEDIRDDLNYVIKAFKWNVGLSNYYEMTKKEKTPSHE